MSETQQPASPEPLAESAYELRAAIRSGEITSREVVERSLARIEATADLGAFIEVTAETALEQADAADERARRHRADLEAPPIVDFSLVGTGTTPMPAVLPSLHGMPIAHKDLYDVQGVPTTRGSAALPHAPAARNSPGVTTLREAGAISLGKTQIPELGLNSYSENLIAAPSRNPLDPSRTSGGSSGGSAAAVASGALPFAPGSDGGGSIRIPALACGLVGLKPGLGAIATDVIDGVIDEFGAPRLTVSGPIARDARDAAMLFDAMRGNISEPSVAAVRAADALVGLRIGASFASPFESAHPTPVSAEERAAVETAAMVLQARGHEVELADISYDPRYPEVFGNAWIAGLSLLKLTPEAESKLTPLTRAFRERALSRSEAQHRQAAADLTEISAGLRAAWSQYDVILTPGLAFAPPKVGAFTELDPFDDYQMQCEFTPYTSMVNVSGLPAVAVPIQTLPSGLSVGVQLIGAMGREPRLLQLAEQLMH